MNLFELSAKLGLDASGFTKGVKNAESAGSNLSEKMSGMLGKIESAAKIFVSGAAINKAVNLVRNLANETAAAGDRIDKQSQVLGMSRKAYQEWDYIMSQNGMTIDQMSTSMKTLNSTILNGLDGSKEAKSAFAELGLSIHDLEGMSQEEQFETVVRAFQKMPAGAAKSALAVKLFGKAGMQMLPLLNNSSTSIDELRQKAQDLGLIMSDDAIDASVKYTDSLDTLKRTFNGLKYAIGEKVLPFLTKGMEKLTNYFGKLHKAYDEGGWLGVWHTLKADWDGFVQHLKESDNGFLAALGKVLEDLGKAAEFVIGLFTDFPGTVENLQGSDSPLLVSLGDMLKNIKGAFESVVDWIKKLPEMLSSAEKTDSPLLTALNSVLTIINDLLTGITDGITALCQVIQGDYAGAMETLQNSNSFLGQSIAQVITDFQTAKYRIDEAIDSAKEFFGLSGSGGKLYETYIGKKSKEWSELKTEQEKNEWLETLGQDMMKAGFTAKQASEATQHFRKYNIGDTAQAGMVATELGLLSKNNPIYYDKAAIIEGWTRRDNWKPPEAVASQKIFDTEQEAENAVTDFYQAMSEIKLNPQLTLDASEEAQKVRDQTQDVFNTHPVNVPLNPQVHLGGSTLTPNMPEGFGESRTINMYEGAPHAKGLWDVPYDGYLAELHRGERVLSASQARRSGGDMDIGSMVSSISAAVKDAIENATIRTFVNGRDMTDEVNRNNMQRLKARRFAT